MRAKKSRITFVVNMLPACQQPGILSQKPFTMLQTTVSPLVEKYHNVRNHSKDICKPLMTEDYVVQPVVFVSPPKWHLGHTTWFFETMLLKEYLDGYEVFHPDYNYVFNSYYETVGARVVRTDRGNLSRPSVEDVYRYRKHVDEAMEQLLEKGLSDRAEAVIEIGLNHEQQHQELLLTDIKYILGNNPLFPHYLKSFNENPENGTEGYTSMEEGVYEIGHAGDSFCYDNELQRHKVYLNEYSISNRLITNGEFLEFIKDGGYQNFRFWHSEAWEWVKTNQVKSPLYWHHIDDKWHEYTLAGLKPLNEDAMLKHVSYYEAFAFAQWKGQRLPTEFEWEAAAERFKWGARWEWTESSYLPYPGFAKEEGALGEYNGKFMVSQKVLRGASIATPEGHSRKTYRNFFYPNERWQFTGIRLAK